MKLLSPNNEKSRRLPGFQLVCGGKETIIEPTGERYSITNRI